MKSIQRALISVSDKTGIVDFARQLAAFNVEILSTGGTAKLLAEQNIPVTEVSDYTGFPEMMDGRVKTLHPKVHGGILGRRGTDDAVMTEHDIRPIDLVAVNLYPFERTIENPDCDLTTAIENIDIGGPTMVRSAAKNHRDVAIVVNPIDYDRVLQEMQANAGQLSDATRFRLATAAFEHTARYDGAISEYLSSLASDGNGGGREKFPDSLHLHFRRRQSLRYGENPHQDAAWYADESWGEPSVTTAELLQGKPLSYNNVADADAALECVKAFSEAPACVIVKHANPCGVATAENIATAYDRAFATDPTSAFGGIIAFNQPLDAATAKQIVDRQFVEVIIAPSIEREALEVIGTKPNVRALATGEFGQAYMEFDLKRVTGGLLVQDRDLGAITLAELKVVTKRQPSEQELRDLHFAWRVAKFVKSNAIVYAKDGQTIGVGAGQMSRVISAKIAGLKAEEEGLTVPGSVMASDAFFPFRDGLDAAGAAGIRAVIQPGGSMRDDEVIAAADEHDIAMVFTGMRHFRH